MEIRDKTKKEAMQGVFRCTICLKDFERRSSLRQHQVTHTGKKTHECAMCGSLIYQKNQLDTSMDPAKVKVTCEQCEKRYRLKKHQPKLLRKGNKPKLKSNDISKLFRCRICGKDFAQLGFLRRHSINHTKNMPFECKMCDKRFQQKLELDEHVTSHSSKKPFSCSQCQKSFKLAIRLYHHKKNVHDTQILCEPCNQVLSNSFLYEEHLKVHHGSSVYSCDECGLKFPKKLSLGNHLKTHENRIATVACRSNYDERSCVFIPEQNFGDEEDAKFNCAHCKKVFFANDELTRHLALFHSPQRQQFQCELCLKTFEQDYMLSDHVLVAHITKQYPSCFFCKKKFESDAALKRHISCAHQEKKFQCPKCLNRFSMESLLKRHMLTHSKKTPANFSCQSCDLSFPSKQSLSLHVEQHSSYTCALCNETFAEWAEFFVHTMTHETYDCVYCENKFSQKLKFLEHLERHTDIYEYSCKECGCKCPSVKTLERHRVRFHEPKLKLEKDVESAEADWEENFVRDVLGHSESEGALCVCLKCNYESTRKSSAKSQCPECHWWFKSEQSMKRHMKKCVSQSENAAVESFVPKATNGECADCSQTQAKLRRLIDEIERSEIPFCQICKRMFKTKYDFVQHVIKDHSGYREQCDACDECFMFKSDLRVHKLKHAQEQKERNCGNCGESLLKFWDLRNARIERIERRKMQLEKKFRCEACGCAFFYQGRYKRHTQEFCSRIAKMNGKKRKVTRGLERPAVQMVQANIVDFEANDDLASSNVFEAQNPMDLSDPLAIKNEMEDVDVKKEAFDYGDFAREMGENENLTTDDPEFILGDSPSDYEHMKNLHAPKPSTAIQVSETVTREPKKTLSIREDIFVLKEDFAPKESTDLRLEQIPDNSDSVLENVLPVNESAKNDASVKTYSRPIFRRTQNNVAERAKSTQTSTREAASMNENAENSPMIIYRLVLKKDEKDASAASSSETRNATAKKKKKKKKKKSKPKISSCTLGKASLGKKSVKPAKANESKDTNGKRNDSDMVYIYQGSRNAMNEVQHPDASGDKSSDNPSEVIALDMANPVNFIPHIKTGIFMGNLGRTVGKNGKNKKGKMVVLQVQPVPDFTAMIDTIKVILDIPEDVLANGPEVAKKDAEEKQYVYKILFQSEIGDMEKRMENFVRELKRKNQSRYDVSQLMDNFCKLDRPIQASYYKQRRNVWNFACEVVPASQVYPEEKANRVECRCQQKCVWKIRADKMVGEDGKPETLYPPFILRILNAFQIFFGKELCELDVFEQDVPYDALTPNMPRKMPNCYNVPEFNIQMEVNFKDQVKLSISLMKETASIVEIMRNYFCSIPMAKWNVRLIYVKTRSGKNNDVRSTQIYGPEGVNKPICGIYINLITPTAKFFSNMSSTEIMVHLVSTYLEPSPEATLLELGCKIGLIGLIMASKYKQVIGIDRHSNILTAAGICKINKVQNASYYVDTNAPTIFEELQKKPKIHAIVNKNDICGSSTMESLRKIKNLSELILITRFDEISLDSIWTLMQPNDDSSSAFFPVRGCVVDVNPDQRDTSLAVILMKRANLDNLRKEKNVFTESICSETKPVAASNLIATNTEEWNDNDEVKCIS